MAVDSGLTTLVEQWAIAIVEDAAQNLADTLVPPVDTGRLADSKKVESSGPLSAVIAFDAETDAGEGYGSFSDQGTPPHLIVGNPLLAFEWHGQLVIVHSVQHPGNVGTGWFSDNVTDDTWAAQLEAAAGSREL